MSTFTPHYCTVCHRPVDQHSEDCRVKHCCGHWPALCCPGCDCESFELAHPEGNITFVDDEEGD